jgi:hypothetical protein
MEKMKWGAVRVNEQLVKQDEQLLRIYNDPSLNPLLQSLDRGSGGNMPPGQGTMVMPYGDNLVEYGLVHGYFPGIDSGVLTINTSTSGHQFLTPSSVLVLDDGAAVADAVILSPAGALMVENL